MRFSFTNLGVYVVLGFLVGKMTQAFGLTLGFALYSLLVCACTSIAALLLRAAELETITWKNRLAGVLLPWTLIVGGGTFKGLLIKNAMASLCFGMLITAGVYFRMLDRPTVVESNADISAGGWLVPVLNWLSCAGWVFLLGAWIYLLRTYIAHRQEPLSTLIFIPRARIPLLLPPVLIVASIFLRYSGYLWASMLTIWVPVLIILSPVILMSLLIVAYSLMGKPIRWN